MLPSNRYEDEINKRAAAENEFVLLKKVHIHQRYIHSSELLGLTTNYNTFCSYIILFLGC